MDNIAFQIIKKSSVKLSDNFHFSFRQSFGETYAKLQNSSYQLVKFSGDFEGYIPILIKDSKIIKTLKFLFNPVNKGGVTFSSSDELTVVEAFISFLKSNKIVQRIVQPVNWMLFQSAPKNSISVPFGSYRIDLSQGEREIWKGLHTKHRNVIRNAQKKGGEIKIGADQIAVFYSLYKATMKRSFMYFEPKSFFEDLIHKKDLKIFTAVVYHEGNPMGGLFVPYSKEGAYYVYGASAERITLTGAFNFLQFELIKFMIDNKVLKYDFVGARLSDISGTKFEGIQKFKARFGGELVEGVLWKMDLNKIKCKLYDNILNLKLKFIGFKNREDIIDQELKKI